MCFRKKFTPKNLDLGLKKVEDGVLVHVTHDVVDKGHIFTLSG